MQRENRWKKIRISNYNNWYKEIKRKKVPGYLKNRWREKVWQRMAIFKLGSQIKDVRNWEGERNRLCKDCEIEMEEWKHVWEECGKWGVIRN